MFFKERTKEREQEFNKIQDWQHRKRYIKTVFKLGTSGLNDKCLVHCTYLSTAAVN
jgi:hypothetical protein